MFKAFCVLLSLIVVSAATIAADKVSNFHRLILVNDQNELFLLHLQDHGFWVTPGWYQDGKLSVKEGLAKLAADHGYTISEPELRGMFTLTHPARGTLSNRNFHVAKVTGGTLVLPKFADKGEWLSLEKVLERLSFEHISVMTRHVFENPNVVWGGAMERTGEGFGQQAKITEAFYPMFDGRR